MSELKSVIREIELCVKIGLPRPVVTKMRQTNLVEGVDWFYSARPKAVCYTEDGMAKMEKLISVEIPAEAPVVQKWLANGMIPKISANGLILTKGRPGWWTDEEAVVIGNAFANRKAIRVRWNDREVICRVKNAVGFAIGMVIPVRAYEHILVSARQPRAPGRW